MEAALSKPPPREQRFSAFAFQTSQSTKWSRSAGPAPYSLGSCPPPKRRVPYLPAGAGTVGDFHAPVLRLADTVGGLDQRTALAERFGRDHTVGDTTTRQ